MPRGGDLGDNENVSQPRLPGVHELLSPAEDDLSSDLGKSQSQAFPPLASLLSPQAWQHPSASTFPPNLARPFAPGGSAASQHGSAYAPGRNTVSMGPPYPPQARPASVHGAVEYAQLGEPRRDSARSTSAFGTGTAECIGQQHFPGRGLCYVYRDGATCPIVIDGEVVNPLWGTTKAGKARKRLAQACLNCREKKIRCEPRHSRCLQCEKSKRECIMPSMNNFNSDPPSNAIAQSALPLLTPAPDRQSVFDAFYGPAPPQSTAFKRRRSNDPLPVGYQSDAAREFAARPKMPSHAADSRSSFDTGKHNMENENSSPAHDSSDLTALEINGWNTDPFQLDQNETMRLLDVFFTQTWGAYKGIWLRDTFMRWVVAEAKKIPDECMLLYSMLALAGAVTRSTSRFARICNERALTAANANLGKFSLCLVQTRMLLAELKFYNGDTLVASDYLAGAKHAVVKSGYFDEETCLTSTERNTAKGTVFGFTTQQMVECRRRTFWTMYLLDKMGALYNTPDDFLQNDLIHLRYPCTQEHYEESKLSRAPMYSPAATATQSSNEPDTKTTSPQAYLIEIAAILSQVSSFTFPSVHYPLDLYAKEYHSMIRTVDERVTKWSYSVPSRYRLDTKTIPVASEDGELGLMTGMHAVHHAAIIQVTRFVKHAALDSSVRTMNIQRAYQSAQHLLYTAGLLCQFAQSLPEGKSLLDFLSPSFTAALFLAVDTVCAGGHFKDLPNLLMAIMHGYTIMEISASSWPFARRQKSAVEQRVSALQVLLHDPERIPAGFDVIDRNRWRCLSPMTKTFQTDHDLSYGVDVNQYLTALCS